MATAPSTQGAEASRATSVPIGGECTILSSTANPELAHIIGEELQVSLPLPRFPDGETSVELPQPVRGTTVFIFQPKAPPVNDHLIELLAFADACRRASAVHVCAVIPRIIRAMTMPRGTATLRQGALPPF